MWLWGVIILITDQQYIVYVPVLLFLFFIRIVTRIGRLVIVCISINQIENIIKRMCTLVYHKKWKINVSCGTLLNIFSLLNSLV
uniref:Uncharacterized protein n=1 Tax=Octopus bimaculoides TaxID=37653 RepID=A0A0L8HAE3_OCTBM